MTNRGVEDRLPYLASAFTGIISYLLTIQFLDKNLGILFVFLVIFTLILFFANFNMWAFFGSLLIGFIAEAIGRGDFVGAQTVAWIFLIGTILNIVVVARASFGTGRKGTSSISRNAFFAMVGAAISVFMMLIVFLLMGKSIMESTEQTYTQIFLYYFVACCGIYFISPIIWSPLFAALSQVNFDLSRPGRILKQMFKGYGGWMLTGIINIIIFIAIDIMSTIMSLFSEASGASFGEYLYAFVFFILTLVGSYGIGWGVSWGDNG